MEDKAFNDKPMLVVVSDGLDPRIQRQLKAQLHSEMMSISQVDAEIKNQEASANIKQQLDSVKDESKFDENKTKEQTPPEPVEDSAKDDAGQIPDANGESGTQGQPDGSNGENDPFTGEAGHGDQPATPSPSGENANTGGSQEGQDPNAGNGSPTDGQPATNTDTPPKAGEADPFTGETGETSSTGEGAPDQAQSSEQPAGNGQTTPPAKTPPVPNGDNGKDPFTDEAPTFEAFAGILGLSYKQEDASKQTKAETPPMKQLVYIRGTDQGVDQRTSATVAALEDPQNTVVIIDLSDVGEVESKMQFSSLKKQLQERGITVVETVDQAVDFLNDVYDQISGGGND